MSVSQTAFPVECLKLGKSAAELAVQYHSQGFNCAESVFKGLCEAYGLKAPPEIATGFGLGSASGCQCGTLTGAGMALGLRFGRTASSQDKTALYGKMNRLHEEFKAAVKSSVVCCKVLRGKDRGKCSEYVRIAAEIASKIIEEG